MLNQQKIELLQFLKQTAEKFKNIIIEKLKKHETIKFENWKIENENIDDIVLMKSSYTDTEAFPYFDK